MQAVLVMFRSDGERRSFSMARDMTVIVMFDRAEGIRLTHSPSGGGVHKELQTTNPAWDFQYVLPKYEVKKEYGFRARLAYRPRCTRAEVLREVAGWKR